VTKPRKWRQTRERGHPTELIGFRCPEEIVAEIDAIDADRSKVLVRLLDQALDARRELGKGWDQIEEYARREDISEGEALARLAKAALQ
jgi:hypothetical protein